MIRYATGNLLATDVEALVNPVNCVGVMGKGLAVQFKHDFPGACAVYNLACKAGKVKVGHVYAVRHSEVSDPAWIIHFPTKQHWRDPSRLEWITEGLIALRHTIEAKGIRSIAIPALGCGNGKLAWEDVKAEIENVFGRHPSDVVVYEPGSPSL